MDIPTRFEAKEAEPRIYRMWEESGAFRADPSSGRESYTIVIPPPNVTGALHLGHALNNTLQDLLIRWKRMDGFEALYLPGTDHAGIATQNAVEKQLRAEESKSRHDIGREEFVRRVWAWKEKYGNTILSQLRRLGCSCDWSRTRFTMDEGYSRAVRAAFVHLFKRGFIYRGKRVINWCPRCLTALSDLEVKVPEESKPGKLWHLRYPVKGMPGKHVVVATTRPETMLGDTAVAVNSRDERWAWAVEKTLVLPLAGREIPVIADDVLVEAGFGTGAVKVTPAHDFNDFECGRRHGLPMVNVLEPDGRMNASAGPYAGLDRFAARKRVVADLESQGLLEKVEDYAVRVGQCDRCTTVVEPYLSDQWFCRMGDLAAPAILAVQRGEIRFTPERYAKTYLDWMGNLRDWCISRQLWWGHRIPVWTCACGQATASVDPIAVCPACGGRELTQDEDVLDTWFSSALWPFATMGWPEETEDLERFYPTQTLVTSRDIINLWVARMIMTGFEFRGEKPFTDVLIHATLMDDEGKRQQKSLGTGVDPLHVIAEYGADPLRFALAWLTTGTQDIRFGKGMSAERTEMARNFVTKLWNAARFVTLKAAAAPAGAPGEAGPAERWILSRLHTTIEAVTSALERFEFGPAAQLLYDFVWDDFCSWSIELSKDRLEDESVRRTLSHVLDASLRLLHPFCPFVTEEIWSIRRRAEGAAPSLLIRESWPEADAAHRDAGLEAGMSLAFEVVRAVREMRNQYKVSPAEPLEAVAVPKDAAAAELLSACADRLRPLAGLSSLKVASDGRRPEGMRPAVSEHVTTWVGLGRWFDPAAERARLDRERTDTVQGIERAERQLANEAFRRAKPELAAETEVRIGALRAKLAEIEVLLGELKG